MKSAGTLSYRIWQIAYTEVSGIRKWIKKSQFYTHPASTHNIRIGVKRIRALLRLVRDPFSDTSYHKQDKAWRAVANSLGPLRNIHVQLKLLRQVCRQNSQQMTNGKFDDLQKSLLKEREKHLNEVAASKKLLKLKLRAARNGIKRWPLKGLEQRNLRAGIKRSHHRFLEAYEEAKESPTIKRLHKLRKRTKDLTYQFEMITGLGAVSLRKFRWKLTQLGKNLGDDHDLALLELKAAKFDPKVSKEFQKSVCLRRAELQKSAFELSKELSVVKPAEFDHLIKK